MLCTVPGLCLLLICWDRIHIICRYTQIARSMRPTRGPPGTNRDPSGPHVGPMNLAIRAVHYMQWMANANNGWRCFTFGIISKQGLVDDLKTSALYNVSLISTGTVPVPSLVIVRRAGLLWSQQDFEWRWSVPLFKCLTVLEFSFILFDLCLLITFFNFIMNYVPIVTFLIFTYHKIWILSIMFCFIWSYWIIYFLACLEVSWRVVS